MVSFVNSIPNNYIVMVGVNGSATHIGIDFDFLTSCGASNYGNMLVNEVYGLIGRKG